MWCNHQQPHSATIGGPGFCQRLHTEYSGEVIVALVTAQASRRLEVLDPEGSGAAAGASPAEGPGAGAGAAAVRPNAALTAGG